MYALFLALLVGQILGCTSNRCMRDSQRSLHLTGLNGTIPQTYGVVLFRGFDLIDVYGPTEILQLIGQMHKTQILFLSEKLEPVTTQPLMAMMNPQNSSVYPSLTPTHTFETAPELDVLIIPGGPGMRSPDLNNTLKYIEQTVPKVKHVITICTGSGLAARAGIMNGKKVG